MRINYDFADLEAFLAVNETESFHLAAERLALSQSAVTRRVRKLETALGSQLFDRTTRRVRPTLAAKRLAARAEAMLEDARETARAMRDESVALAHQRNLVITLAAVPTALPALLPPALEIFRGQGHRARLRILDLAANEAAEAVVGGEADFGVGSAPMLEPQAEFETLFEDRMGLTLSQDHPLAAQDGLTWADLDHADLILPARGAGNRALIDEAMARDGRTLTWVYETRRSATARALAAAGVGAAVLPHSAMDDAPRRVTWRPLSAPEITRPIGLITRIGQEDAPAAAALKAALRTASKLRG